jgi:hypothetical protein
LPGEDGLRGPGHILDQDVAATGEGREDEPHLTPLAAYDELDVLEQPGGGIRDVSEAAAC